MHKIFLWTLFQAWISYWNISRPFQIIEKQQASLLQPPSSKQSLIYDWGKLTVSDIKFPES